MRTVPSNERRWLGWSACLAAAVIGALIWLCWVLPARASVAGAAVVGSGHAVSVEARAGERIGVWASGRAAILGSLECTATGPDQVTGGQRTFHGLDWDDTLWWATPRPGFAPYAGLEVSVDGSQRVICSDSLGTYEAEYLLAQDVNAPGRLGLGRGGGVDVPVASALAFGAVVAPLLAVLLVPIMTIQSLRARRARRRGQG